MKIHIDTVKYKISTSIITTQDFSKYLQNNGIENYDPNYNPENPNDSEKKKSYIYKRVSNECREFIKGSAGHFTLFKSHIGNDKKSIFFEFYGLKSYCNCIDDIRSNVVRLFHSWIQEKQLTNKTNISAIDIAFDFENIHPIGISLQRENTRGKQPKINLFPSSKTFFDKSTYYLYDKQYLEYQVNIKYSQQDLEDIYNELFAYETEDDYIFYSFSNYNKELSYFKWMSELLKKDENSFGLTLNQQYIPISHYKDSTNKILEKLQKNDGQELHDKFFSNNKKNFMNINDVDKEGIYYKEEIHATHGLKKKLFIDSNEYHKKQELYIFVQELIDRGIVYSIKPKKDFQVILYDKKNKVNEKYCVDSFNYEELARVEFKIRGIDNIEQDITKKIDLIKIVVHNEHCVINFQDIQNILLGYTIS